MNRKTASVGASLLAILCLLAVSLACQVNPVTGKKELMLLTTADEVAIGKNVNAELLKEYKASDDPRENARVQRLGVKLAAVSDRQDISYSFGVVATKDINAFAAPGGYVYATTGLVESASEDELACVIGHEVGHVAGRHLLKTMQAALGAQIILILIDSKSRREDLVIASQVVVGLMMKGYSRQHEYEADILGARYAWRAGYNPRGLVSFFRKIEVVRDGQTRPPEFLSTHPDTDKRISAVEAVIRTEMTNPDGTLKRPPAPERTSDQNVPRS